MGADSIPQVEAMFPAVQQRLKIWKYQRSFAKVNTAYAVDIAIARMNKKTGTEIDKIKEQSHWELSLIRDEMDFDVSNYLFAEAHRYLVPIPNGDDDWSESSQLGVRFLSRKGAKQVRDDIRSEKKATWDYWTNRITLALALIGSIFGVLAYFKK
jgi:hypothetical protein